LRYAFSHWGRCEFDEKGGYRDGLAQEGDVMETKEKAQTEEFNEVRIGTIRAMSFGFWSYKYYDLIFTNSRLIVAKTEQCRWLLWVMFTGIFALIPALIALFRSPKKSEELSYLPLDKIVNRSKDNLSIPYSEIHRIELEKIMSSVSMTIYRPSRKHSYKLIGRGRLGRINNQTFDEYKKVIQSVLPDKVLEKEPGKKRFILRMFGYAVLFLIILVAIGIIGAVIDVMTGQSEQVRCKTSEECIELAKNNFRRGDIDAAKKFAKKPCDDMKDPFACYWLSHIYSLQREDFMEEEFLKKGCDNAKGAKVGEYYFGIPLGVLGIKEDYDICYKLVSFYELHGEMQKANEVLYRMGQRYEKEQRYPKAAEIYYKLCSLGVSKGCDAYERLKKEGRIQ
jgi:hypothetical protein